MFGEALSLKGPRVRQGSGHPDELVPAVGWSASAPAPSAVPLPRLGAVPCPRGEQHGEQHNAAAGTSGHVRAAAFPLHPGETTVLVRHIPAGYTQEKLVEEWRLVGMVNLLFLPLTPQGHRNLGYTIINFASGTHAWTFYHQWQGHHLRHSRRVRPLDIRRSKIQGFYQTLDCIMKSQGRRQSGGCLPLGFNGSASLDMQRLLRDLAKQSHRRAVVL